MAVTGSKTVKFNVGGQSHEVSRSLLDLHPNTMLTKSASSTWHTDTSDSEIYIDRNGSRFQYVLDYLRDGRVILPVTESREALINELNYFNIDCCEDAIQLSAGQTANNGLQILQKTVLKWRCADLAADCLEACWKESTWRGGNKMYLSFQPKHFNDTLVDTKEKEILEMCNEYLSSVGVKITSIEFDRIRERCRVTMKLISNSSL